MTEIYCGNNAQNPGLVSGDRHLGTRYRCFRKGIGVGRNLPVDPSYAGPYTPIDPRRTYCGKSNEMPGGYDIMGNPPMCLQKGVGLGKVMAAGAANDGYSPRSSAAPGVPHLDIACYFAVGAIILFLVLYLVKPGMRQKKSNKIRWKRFVFVYALALVLFALILFLWFQSTGDS